MHITYGAEAGDSLLWSQCDSLPYCSCGSMAQVKLTYGPGSCQLGLLPTLTYRSWYRCLSIFLESRYFLSRRRRTRIRRIHRIFVGSRASRVPLRLPGQQAQYTCHLKCLSLTCTTAANL